MNVKNIKKSGYLFIILVFFLFLMISVSTAETCFAGSPHICGDYVDNDGNGVCDHDPMNDQYPAGYKPSLSPSPTPTPNTTVSTGDTGLDQTDNPESNLYYDPETETYFDLNKFGYYRSGPEEFSDEELEERWNEIIKEKGIEIPEQIDTSEEVGEILSSATSLSLDSVLENEGKQPTGDLEPSETDQESLEVAEENEDTDDNNDGVNNGVSLEAFLLGSVTSNEKTEPNQESSIEEKSAEDDLNDQPTESNSNPPVDYENQAMFIKTEWDLKENTEDLVTILKENPELSNQIQEQLTRYLNIYEKDYPDYDLKSIAEYDETEFKDALRQIPSLVIPGKVFVKLYKLANIFTKAVRDQTLGVSTFVEEKGNQYLNLAKQYELNGNTKEDAQKKAWLELDNSMGAADPYLLTQLQDLGEFKDSNSLKQFLSEAYAGQYEIYRMKDDELIGYEQKQNAIIRNEITSELHKKLSELKQRPGYTEK